MTNTLAAITSVQECFLFNRKISMKIPGDKRARSLLFIDGLQDLINLIICGCPV